uniref:CLASP N-terminal domain-containing protein n=1 Tax=Cyprinodon variegatus TaxID=28743 RepID=A0A3Q2EEI0_CYPVA
MDEQETFIKMKLDEDSVDGGRSSSSSSSKAPPGGRRPAVSSVRRPSSGSSTKSTGEACKEAAAGAVDEEDFIKAFDDVPSVQVGGRVMHVKERSGGRGHAWFNLLVLQGLTTKDCRTLFVLHVSCCPSVSIRHLSSVLQNKFDHGAESVMPTLLNLVPNSAKVMATSGMAAIRLILRHTHYPRLIPIITSNCSSKSVAVRRRCYEFLDLMLQEWHTNTLERGDVKKQEENREAVHIDREEETRGGSGTECYWGFHGHYSREAELLFQALESTYQKALQSHLRSSDSVVSLPQSDRSSSSSQESLKEVPPPSPVNISLSPPPGKLVGTRVSSTPGSLQRSRSDIDVNAASSAKSRLSSVPASSPFSSAAALPPGSYASLGKPPLFSPLYADVWVESEERRPVAVPDEGTIIVRLLKTSGQREMMNGSIFIPKVWKENRLIGICLSFNTKF